MPAEIAARIGRLRESTAHLEHTLAGLTDELARGDSLLPGWSRGHVATHLARNADALVNLTVWAQTGVETPMYPSVEARAAAIAAGADRPAAELVADVHAASDRLFAAFEGMSEVDWSGQWDSPDPRPAGEIVTKRLVEVEVHHVDLDLQYTMAHWPEDFVEELIAARVADLGGRGDVPGLTLVGNDDEGTWTLGDGRQVVNGPPPSLLGWLIGRSSGIGLHSDQPLPHLGAWK